MKIRINHLFLALALVCGAAGCEKPETGFLWRDEWKEPEVPDQPDQPETPELPEIKGKPRLVWIDAAANFNEYANSGSKIASDVKKIAEMGFTHIVVDVRPTTTGVLFKSSVEHGLDKVDAWVNGSYVWLKRTESFDYLQKFIDAGHENGLRVFASMNTFVGGYLCPYGLGSDGIFYRGTAPKSWASVINAADGLVNTMDLQDYETDCGAKFRSPANDEVQDYLLKLIGELAAYDVDGVILDRCRFDDYNLMSDFSDSSREKFEDYLGKKVENFGHLFSGTERTWQISDIDAEVMARVPCKDHPRFYGQGLGQGALGERRLPVRSLCRRLVLKLLLQRSELGKP